MTVVRWNKPQMRARSRLLVRTTLLCLVVLLVTAPVFGKHKEKRQTIVCPAHPKDSRGETVYKLRGPTENQPEVPGTFVEPKPVAVPAPQYEPASNRPTIPLHVTVEGVVTQNGDFIDATVPDDVDPEVSKSVMDSLPQAHFKPATLDGKPVAAFTRVDVVVFPK